MNTIYKTKHKCAVCHDYIKVKYNRYNYSYYECKNCNIIYVFDKKIDKMVRAYEPRKTIKF